MNLSFRRCDVGWGLPCPRRQGLATAALFESERRFIDVENRFHLLAVVDRHFPEAHALTHDLGVVTLRFGFVIDVADIVADTLFLFLQPLDALDAKARSEEHTSELQSLMRISYAVFFLKKTQMKYLT